MKNLLKILTFGAVLAASTTAAFASPMPPNGSTLRICCNAVITQTGSGVNAGLSFTNPESLMYGSGGLQTFTSAILTSTFTFAGVHPGAGELLFTSTSGANTLQFYVTGYTYTNKTLTFTGYLTLNGVAGPNATMTNIIGNPGPGGTGNYYEGDLVTTPEPSSLILLGTGLAGAAGLLVRRRKLIQA